ncbi:hypothetical protein L9F63_021596, partial [Diploptera punctata]
KVSTLLPIKNGFDPKNSALLELFIIFIINLILLICILVGVAFLTLLECKVLGYVHIRKGPNKVGFVGILQPFRDAIKACRPCWSRTSFGTLHFTSVINLFPNNVFWTMHRKTPFATQMRCTFFYIFILLFFPICTAVSSHSILHIIKRKSSLSECSLTDNLKHKISHNSSLGILTAFFICLFSNMPFFLITFSLLYSIIINFLKFCKKLTLLS